MSVRNIQVKFSWLVLKNKDCMLSEKQQNEKYSKALQSGE